MTLKEKIENSPVLYTLGLLATGFVAGLGAYKGILEIAGPRPTDISPSSWMPVARSSDWLPKSECPAFPVSLSLSNPGSGSLLGVSGDTIYSDIVIQASRPLPETNVVGLILNQEGDPNFYVARSFGLRADPVRRIFKSEKFVFLPFEPKHEGKLHIWAFSADDANKLGTAYGSLEKVKQSVADITLSSAVVINVKAR